MYVAVFSCKLSSKELLLDFAFRFLGEMGQWSDSEWQLPIFLPVWVIVLAWINFLTEVNKARAVNHIITEIQWSDSCLLICFGCMNFNYFSPSLVLSVWEISPNFHNSMSRTEMNQTAIKRPLHRQWIRCSLVKCSTVKSLDIEKKYSLIYPLQIIYVQMFVSVKASTNCGIIYKDQGQIGIKKDKRTTETTTPHVRQAKRRMSSLKEEGILGCCLFLSRPMKRARRLKGHVVNTGRSREAEPELQNYASQQPFHRSISPTVHLGRKRSRFVYRWSPALS